MSTDANVKTFGAVGNSTADDSTAIVAANRSAMENGGSVFFPPGQYLVASELVITAPVTFSHRAILLAGSTTTIILKGAITALPEPIFECSAGGAFRIEWEGEIYANWWAGVDIGERWNNMMKACRNGPRKFLVVGQHVSFTGLDATRLNNRAVLDFSASRITFRMNGGVALDLTGSVGVTVNKPHFVGFQIKDDLTNDELPLDQIPDVGILLSRNEGPPETPGDEDPIDDAQTEDEEVAPTGPPGSNRHILNDAWVEGYWKLAALYNIGSEVNRHLNCFYKNASPLGKYAAFFGKTNRDGVTSAFDVTPGNGTPPTTATGQELYGTHILGTRCTEAVMYVWGFSGIVNTNGFIGSGQSPYLVIDATPDALGLFRATGLYCHHSPRFGTPSIGIDIRREVSFVITDDALTALQSAGLPDPILAKLTTIKEQLVIGAANFLTLLRTTIEVAVSAEQERFIVAQAITNHEIEQLHIAALRINVKKDPRDDSRTAIRIGDLTLRFPHLEWSQRPGLLCDPQCNIYDGLILTNGSVLPTIKLGRDFSGHIVMGTTDELLPATNSMRGTVLFTGPKRKSNQDRLHHFSPITFEKRARPPALENGQATLWLSDGSALGHGDGDIILTIKNAAGIDKSVVLADFDKLA